MNQSIARLPNHLRSKRGSELGLLSKVAWIPQEPDADTMRKRALDDARGQLVREGCSWRNGIERQWRVIRSVVGRTDQYDVIRTGQIIDTCGRRKLRSKYGVRL
jgi:hypothetical protein